MSFTILFSLHTATFKIYLNNIFVLLVLDYEFLEKMTVEVGIIKRQGQKNNIWLEYLLPVKMGISQ